MTFEEIELMAVHREKPTEHMRLPDLECFRCLYSLYEDYRKGRIDKERAGMEKRLIHRSFDEAQKEYMLLAEQWRGNQNRIRAAGENWLTLARRVKEGMDTEKLCKTLLDILSKLVGEDVTARTITAELKNREESR